MTSAVSRDSAAEISRLELLARGAGSALACVHQSADELHRALVRDYLARKQARGFWGRVRSLSIFSALFVFFI